MNNPHQYGMYVYSVLVNLGRKLNSDFHGMAPTLTPHRYPTFLLYRFMLYKNRPFFYSNHASSNPIVLRSESTL